MSLRTQAALAEQFAAQDPFEVQREQQKAAAMSSTWDRMAANAGRFDGSFEAAQRDFWKEQRA